MALWCEFLTLWAGLSDPSFVAWLGTLANSPTILADTTEPSLISRIGSQVYIWGSVAVGLGLVIFVHELGHFLAAKLCGVKVEKFYVGFDVPLQLGPIKFPRTLGKFRYGETEYGLGILPLGGYVKMLGQDDDPRNMQAEAERIRGESAAGDEDDEPTEQVPRQELDPRSYPAKSVGQRMLIISAGVIMNVITGVLFAAYAYGVLGVEYTPAVIGATSPGDPAYDAGIEPGGRVLAVDGDTPDPQMHFSRMTMKILTHGISDPDSPVSLELEYPEGIRTVELQTAVDPWNPSRRVVGISSPALARLGDKVFAEPETPASDVFTAVDANADIVAINGNELKVNPLLDVTLNDQVAKYLLKNSDKPVTLSLRRKDSTELHDVTIAPRVMRTLGFAFSVGPIESLVHDGPAEKAGLKKGDRIVAVTGLDNLSAIDLPAQVAKLDGTVHLTVQRGEGEQVETLEFDVEPEAVNATLAPFDSPTGKIALYPLGLAYYPEPIVSQSAVDSLKPGDVISNVAVVWDGDTAPEALQDKMLRPFISRLEDGWDTKEQPMLTSLIRLIQKLPVDTKLRVIAERPPEKQVVDTTVKVIVGDSYWPDRGIVYAPVRFTRYAGSTGEALALGLREGKWKLTEVAQFLRLLVTGKVSRNQVGGPLKIADIAASQAEQGWSPLLLFLTMLSMNLAILNFLPIPALDGGHMVFLIAEAVMGRPVDEQLQMKLTMGGVLALLSLMVFVFANDILTWR